MKSGTTDKLKFKQLMRRLHLSVWQARGLLDTLWEFARNNAPRGDVGRFCNEEIAIGIDWQEDHDKLIAALVETKWLDRLESESRLYVHDWHEHSENSVHKKLVRNVEVFANGCLPNLSAFSINERSGILDKYVKKFPGSHFSENKPGDSETGSQKPETGTRRGPQPEPEPEPDPLPLPIPEPEPAPESKPKNASGSGSRRAGVFDKISGQDLGDTGKVLDWYLLATKERHPVILHSDQNVIRVLACAAKSTEKGIDDPIAMFAWMIGGKNFGNLNDAHYEKARKRLLEYNRQARGSPDQTNALPRPTLRRAT